MEKTSGMWNIHGEYAFYLQNGDWVDEDYVTVLINNLKRLQVDMVISGVIYVHQNYFKRADFYEYEKIVSGKQGRIELFRSGYLENGFCGCLVKRILLEEKEDLYSVLMKANKIGIFNDYKYYHQFVEKKRDSYNDLEKRWNTYQKMLVDWKEEEIRQLFTRKEKVLLDYPVLGKMVCGGSSWLKRNHSNIFSFLQNILDNQMEKRKKLDFTFECIMKETKQYPRILIMGTPEYHNLGDHAIAFAQERFCKNYFPTYKTVNVTEKTILSHFYFLRKHVKDTDLLLLQGGGNMGDEYQSIEALRIKIIQSFPKNQIVIMPQTIHFTDSRDGQALLKKMINVYGLHSKLMLVGREKTSYERMKTYFPKNQIIKCPDIVLSLDIQNEVCTAQNRKGMLLLLRTDAEGTLGVDQLMKMKKLCLKREENLKMAETSVSYGISEEERTEELMKKWTQISSSRLVITDRLHGMIFSAITGTPCLVLSNYNHKIKESYEWIKNLEYIKFCNNLMELENELDKMDQISSKQYCYPKKVLQFHYDQLAMAIKR